MLLILSKICVNKVCGEINSKVSSPKRQPLELKAILEEIIIKVSNINSTILVIDTLNSNKTQLLQKYQHSSKIHRNRIQLHKISIPSNSNSNPNQILDLLNLEGRVQSLKQQGMCLIRMLNKLMHLSTQI